MKFFLHLLVAIAIVGWYPAVGKNCMKVSQCSCTFDDGSGTIDLSSLGKQGGKTALINDTVAPDKYLYSYNPCYGFDEGTCKNAAGCQQTADRDVFFNIGDAAEVTFTYDGANLVATYVSDNDPLKTRYSKVTFVCDKAATKPVTQVLGETAKKSGIYAFTIRTNVVCLKPPKTTTTPGGGGGGSGGDGGIHINITNDVRLFSSSITMVALGLFGLISCGLLLKLAMKRFRRYPTDMKV